jgi:hypothetical protein
MFTPPNWADYELFLMRLFLVLLLFHRGGLPGAVPYRAQSHPIGLARIVDLGFLGRGAYPKLRLGAIPAAVLYVADVLPPVGIAYLALLTLAAVTLINSQGAVNHGLHLSLIVLVAQLAAGLAHPLIDGTDIRIDGLLLDTAAQTAAWWSVQAIMAAYFVSGVSKVARTGFLWVGEASRLSLAMVVQTEVALQDHPRRVKQKSAQRLGIATWLAQHPVLGGLLFGGGLWVELLAPVALLNRFALVLGGLAFIGLHRAIGAVLLLEFRLYQLVLLVYMVNVPYLVVESLRWVGLPESLLP